MECSLLATRGDELAETVAEGARWKVFGGAFAFAIVGEAALALAGGCVGGAGLGFGDGGEERGEGVGEGGEAKG